MSKQVFSKLFIWCEWIMRLAMLNLLFLFFSCAGLIVFGVFPAYSAMSILTKKLLEGEDIAFVADFYSLFKQEFIKSNLFGLIYGYAFILLIVNFLLVRSLPSSYQGLAIILLASIAIILLMSCLYTFPLHAKFNTSTWRLIKNSFLVAIAFLPRTIGTLLLIAVILTLCYYQPILLLIFGFSSISMVMMLNSRPCLEKIHAT